MNCRKCKTELPAGSIYCLVCGAKQMQDLSKKKNTKSRGNGTGSVFKLPNGKWRAEAVLGYAEGGKKIRRTKSGFRTKKDALAYIPKLKAFLSADDQDIKFSELYLDFIEMHRPKVSRSTLDCYASAYKYFEPLYYLKMCDIKTVHIQACIDKCKKGRRTKENMKTLAGLLFNLAMQRDIVSKNYARFAYVPPEDKKEREYFTRDEITAISEAHTAVPYAGHILCLIYTGFRLNEFLNLRAEDYNEKEKYLMGGSKTKAGRNRIVPVSPKIEHIVSQRVRDCNGGYIFGIGGKKLGDKKFRVLYARALDAIGVRQLPPHSCRHTFATLMKSVNAPSVDKQKLIGHSSFEMTAYYTHTDLSDLKNITDKI